MYKKIILLIALAGSTLLYGQRYYSRNLPKQGKIYETNPALSLGYPTVALYDAGDYWGVINKKLSLTEKETPRELYNIAASYDKLNMPDEVLHYLYRFMEISQDDREILAANDFPNLKAHPDKWEKVIQCIDSLFLVAIGEVENKKLALKIFHLSIDRIIVIMQRDSFPNRVDMTTPAFVTETDKLLKKYGFPTEKMVGRYGVFHVYDVMQHSELLDKHYPKAKKIFKKGALDSILYALMTDRALTHKNKKQIYGTQWTKYVIIPKSQFGKYVKKYPDKFLLEPVKDFANLNERRKQMGFTDTVEEEMKYNKESNYFIPPEYYETKSKKQK